MDEIIEKLQQLAQSDGVTYAQARYISDLMIPTLQRFRRENTRDALRKGQELKG